MNFKSIDLMENFDPIRPKLARKFRYFQFDMIYMIKNHIISFLKEKAIFEIQDGQNDNPNALTFQGGHNDILDALMFQSGHNDIMNALAKNYIDVIVAAKIGISRSEKDRFISDLRNFK